MDGCPQKGMCPFAHVNSCTCPFAHFQRDFSPYPPHHYLFRTPCHKNSFIVFHCKCHYTRAVSLLHHPVMTVLLYLNAQHEQARRTSQVARGTQRAMRCACAPLRATLTAKPWMCDHVTLHTSRLKHSLPFNHHHRSHVTSLSNSHTSHHAVTVTRHITQ